MTDSIASVFERLTKDLVIDHGLLKRISQYERTFANRSNDHCEFLGGNLMGVNPFRFRTADRDDWFSDVLQMDELELRDAIADLPSINLEWKRASDAMNLSCVWLLHAIHHSHLSVAEKHEGMTNVMLVLQYKFLASLMAHYYPYVADRPTMEAAYASLNRRYSLKVAGSWYRLLKERGEEVIGPSGIHRKTILTFGPDAAVIEMINDIQGRLRKIVKSLTEVFYNIKAQGGKIGVEKSVLNIDGQNVLKDKTKHFTSFIRYIHEIADDPASFIRKELVDVVCDLQHTLPPKQLEEALVWMSINHRVVEPRWEPKVDNGYVEAFMDEVLLHAFSYIATHQGLMTSRSGLGPLLQQLRALYMASRMADPSLLKAKEMADRIVSESISSRNTSVAASVRTGIEIYIVARALTKDYYS